MSADNASGWNANIRKGERAAWELMQEPGIVVFSPHLGAHLDHCDGYDSWDWERWLVYDECVIRAVDAVLMMDNWESSKCAIVSFGSRAASACRSPTPSTSCAPSSATSAVSAGQVPPHEHRPR